MVDGLRERKKRATWHAIRSAALRLIDERGYDNVSIDDMAAAADVSRSTFFNYFLSKEAVVFDADPDQPEAWRAAMRSRPADEPLWTSIAAILIDNVALYGDRLALQKKLKAASPTLADSGRDAIDRFTTELTSWVAGRTPVSEELRATLTLNCALAASTTAYVLWDPNDGFAAFTALLTTCLAEAGQGFR